MVWVAAANDGMAVPKAPRTNKDATTRANGRSTSRLEDNNMQTLPLSATVKGLFP
ncbi:hypothetical protein MAFF301069_35240 (plasmid) [Ralstonia pseudosolanacearum]|nr:hypothetical protein MAFF301560_36260 [Ralstonia solanacearum]BEU48278.1 hypothetical protein MAFF211519_36030 [Ralstonia pseudosolanacearum]BEU68969.1 hypothetical protein MAFF301069_35240 [Ralstonia pseudosolanacearum]